MNYTHLTIDSYGNAQKWINLSIKYVLFYEGTDYHHEVFKNGYFPIDSIIQKRICSESRYSNTPIESIGSWGNCDDWNSIKRFQEDSRRYLEAQGWYSPIIWEATIW